jgi:L-malate glycosyltransferase
VLNATPAAIAAYWKDRQLPANLQLFPTQHDVQPHYAWADLVLNLSLPDQWVETFGLTALEAMAMGLPVIVPPVGGIAELVESGRQGLHVDARDMAALLGALDTLLVEETYDRYSEQARQRALTYNAERFLADSLTILSNPASLGWKMIPESGKTFAGNVRYVVVNQYVE